VDQNLNSLIGSFENKLHSNSRLFNFIRLTINPKTEGLDARYTVVYVVTYFDT